VDKTATTVVHYPTPATSYARAELQDVVTRDPVVTPVNPIEGRADSEYDEALVARLTVRDDLEALMKSLDEMNRQLEMLNSKVALVETKAEKLEERMLVEGGCLVAGKVYEQSERWNGDECTICTCQGGAVTCVANPACAKLTL